MKIRSAIPENGCLIFFSDGKKQKNKKKHKKNICKTYTLPPHREDQYVQDVIIDGRRPQRTAAASLRESHCPEAAVALHSQMFLVVKVSSTLQCTASNITGRLDEWLGDRSARKFSRLHNTTTKQTHYTLTGA